MDVNRIADLCNAVRIFSRSGEVIDRLKALPDDSARFADTDMMRDRMNTGMFESRHMPAQEFQEIAELPPALDFGIGKIKPVDAAFFDDARRIEMNHILFKRQEPEHIFTRTDNLSGGLRLIVKSVDPRAVRHTRRIHTAEFEAQSHRLAESVLIAELEITSGEHGKVAVACAVHIFAGANRAKAGLRAEHSRADPVAVFDHVHQIMMIDHLHARLKQKILHSQHRDIFGNSCSGDHLLIENGFFHFVIAVFPHLAAPVNENRPVKSLAVKMIRHKRRHFPETRHASGAPVAFRQYDFDALPRSHDRRTHSAGTSAHNQHVSLSNHRNFLLHPVSNRLHEKISFF